MLRNVKQLHTLEPSNCVLYEEELLLVCSLYWEERSCENGNHSNHCHTTHMLHAHAFIPISILHRDGFRTDLEAHRRFSKDREGIHYSNVPLIRRKETLVTPFTVKSELVCVSLGALSHPKWMLVVALFTPAAFPLWTPLSLWAVARRPCRSAPPPRPLASQGLICCRRSRKWPRACRARKARLLTANESIVSVVFMVGSGSNAPFLKHWTMWSSRCTRFVLSCSHSLWWPYSLSRAAFLAASSIRMVLPNVANSNRSTRPQLADLQYLEL